MALTVRDLHGPAVNGVSFELRYGEILGFAGLVGAGRTELARVLAGVEPRTSGEILIEQRPVQFNRVRDALEAGIAFVPEDRKRQGLVMTQSVGFNLALPWTREWLRGCRPDEARRTGIVSRGLRNFSIKAASGDVPIGTLSGGNQQKVVVAKWMEHPPKILILDEPTRGVDVGAREEMFTIISRLLGEGMAVLLISSDLSEVLNLSHRVALYGGGRILREAVSAEITPEQVMDELTRAVPTHSGPASSAARGEAEAARQDNAREASSLASAGRAE